MEIVLDVWEGTQLIKAGATPAAGIIVRLNDMNGGHHLDSDFIAQWTEAEKFKAKNLYFVYNPWVSGKANFDWFVANAPGNMPARAMIDHELTYAGSPPVQLTAQVYDFINRVLDWGKTPTFYSGQWFLPSMTKWPKELDYWWMYYPWSLQNAGFMTWGEVLSALERATWPNASICPGPIKLWQACSKQAPGGLPGCNGHDVDINKWSGTTDELIAWFGCETIPTLEQRVAKLESQALLHGWSL